jgi:hypothetical protein
VGVGAGNQLFSQRLFTPCLEAFRKEIDHSKTINAKPKLPKFHKLMKLNYHIDIIKFIDQYLDQQFQFMTHP